MITGLTHLHSYLAYLVLASLFLGFFFFLFGRLRGRPFGPAERGLALLALIFTHLQFLAGLLLYFIGPKGFAYWRLDDVMQNESLRLYAVEHISVNLIGVALITIGYSRAKRQASSRAKFSSLSTFYGLGLLLLLSRIPWQAWLGL